MGDSLRTFFDEQANEIDGSVDEVIAFAGGDVRHALRIAMIANTFLQEENDRLKAQISKGFVRMK